MKKIIITFLFLLSYFCLSWHSLGYAEKQYTITEQELNRLEYNLNKLSEINENNLKELSELKSELHLLKQESEKQERLLQSANQLLEQSKKEEQAKLSKLKRQRNLAYVLCVGIVYMWVKN